MATVAKRERGTLADLFDWFEGEFPAFPAFRTFAGTQVMRIEDYIEDGEYVLRAEVPGIDPAKDVDISLAEGLLTVKAERREEKREPHRSEFRYGSFSRSIALPAGADAEDVSATYADGILEVRVAIKQERTPETKHITITAR